MTRSALNSGSKPTVTHAETEFEMALSEQDRPGLNSLLSRARWLRLRLGSSLAVDLLFQVHQADGASEPQDPRMVIRLAPTIRISASLRTAAWDERSAATVPLLLDELPSVVRGFDSSPFYGRAILDEPEAYERIRGRLSLDVRLREEAARHSMTLLQEREEEGSLRILIEFDDLEAFDGSARRISPQQLSEQGKQPTFQPDSRLPYQHQRPMPARARGIRKSRPGR
jgi:hypothetical protein